jgi:AmmeMemoRadiSam system protein B/AmmeMemoRadiSam system protein A
MVEKVIVLSLSFLLLFSSACKEVVKAPNVAGAFYPSEPEVLKNEVDNFIKRAEYQNIKGELIALISPHAGYQFSGQVAGYAYRNLQDRPVKTVILIGPAHYFPFKGISVYKEGFFRTPLGDVEIDKKVSGLLIKEEMDVSFIQEAFEKEHSLEVQLPFLQRVLKGFRVVPLLVGTPTERSLQHVISVLTELLRKQRDILIIASSDLSHYHTYEEARKMDMMFIDATLRLAIEELQGLLSRGEVEACGAWPVIITMAVARNLGATEGILYKYANSGDITGDTRRVVGYGAIGLYKTELSPEQRSLLLKIARETIFSYIKDKKIPRFNITDRRLTTSGATFVTIKDRYGNLRGCIGNILPVMALYESVQRNAIAASTADPRFPPMRPEELEGISVEVTVLSPLEKITDPEDIVIGRHGLFIVKDSKSGILLPQVPVEFGWDKKTFLKEVSLKAGLPEDAWKDGDLYRFTAEIIKE